MVRQVGRALGHGPGDHHGGEGNRGAELLGAVAQYGAEDEDEARRQHRFECKPKPQGTPVGEECHHPCRNHRGRNKRSRGIDGRPHLPELDEAGITECSECIDGVGRWNETESRRARGVPARHEGGKSRH